MQVSIAYSATKTYLRQGEGLHPSGGIPVGAGVVWTGGGDPWVAPVACFPLKDRDFKEMGAS